MKVNKKLVEFYESDFRDLIERLRRMDNDERLVLYKTHSRILFPKSKEVVNLEYQISGRQDYIHKFKRSFYIIGNSIFSTNHLEDYNQEVFIRKTGYKSPRYPQKVILALSLMGYITKLFRSYSVGHHDYNGNICRPTCEIKTSRKTLDYQVSVRETDGLSGQQGGEGDREVVSEKPVSLSEKQRTPYLSRTAVV